MKIRISRRSFVILLILFIFTLAFLALSLFVGFLFNRDSKELTFPSSNVEYTKWQLPDGAKARLGKGTINDIKFSPDGSQFAVATTIGVWLYDSKSGKEITLLKGDRQDIKSIAFSDSISMMQDKSLLLGTDSAGRLFLWNAVTGEFESILSNENINRITSVFFSEDGSQVVSVSLRQSKIYILNLRDMTTTLQTINLDLDFTRIHNSVIALSNDKRLLAIAVLSEPRHNSPIYVLDMSSGTRMFTLSGHSRWIKTLAFSPDGKTLASGDEYHTIKLWDLDTQTTQSTYKAPESFSALRFLPNSKVLVSGCSDGSIYFWNVTKKQKGVLGKIGRYFPMTMLKKHQWKVTALAISPDGNILVSGSKDGTIRSWTTETGKQQYISTGHTAEITGLTTTTNEDLMMVMHTWDYQLGHWDMSHGKHIYSFYFNNRNPITISPDAKTVVLKDWNAYDPYKIWDISNKRIQTTLTGFDAPQVYFPNIEFSLDGKRLAAAINNKQMGNIHVWNISNQSQSFLKRLFAKTKTIRPDYTLNLQPRILGLMTFSPDGNLLVTVDREHTIYIIDVEQGITHYIQTGHKETVKDLAFSPSGRILASVSDNALYIWDVTTQQEIKNIQMDRTCRVLRFSPDGNTIVCGTYDGKIQLLDAATLSLISTHIGHTNWVNNIVFLDNGKTLASGSRDGTIILWGWEIITQGKQRQ